MCWPEHAVSEAVVALGRALRERGIPASVDEELVLCRALAEVDLRRREQVYWAARSIFLRHRDQSGAFDQVFARFWEGLPLDRPGTVVAEHGEGDPRMTGAQHGGESLPQLRSEGRGSHLLDGNGALASKVLEELLTSAGDADGSGHRQGVLAAYSPNEVLAEREPLGFGSDELVAVRRLAEELRARVPERRSARLRPTRHGGRLDVRRTVGRSLETDGETIRLAFASPSHRPRRLVFICDVSGSMERYSRALLASLRGAVGAQVRAEAFVFATRLTRLTRPLSGHDLARALEKAREAVADWSGGTRIGSALADFNRAYGRLGLARGAIVIIVSDGWDRGDPEVLAEELGRLRLQCRRLVWLNPRPGTLEGQPLAVGMRAALPYVDDFVAGHDPRAIVQLARVIGRLGSGRPARRQRALGASSAAEGS